MRLPYQEDTFVRAKQLFVKKWKLLIAGLLMTFAAIQFLRAYFIVNQPYLDETRYEAGLERMPYQGRILMAYLIRALDHTSWIVRTAAHLRGPLHDPAIFVIACVGIVSVTLTAVVIHRWYLLLSPTQYFSWLPFTMFLWMLYATYLARFQEAIYFPYDLLSLALFTLALFLCFTQSYLFLAVVLSVACLNRETIIVILVPLAINAGLHLRAHPRRNPIREILLAVFLVVVWIGVHVHYSHLFLHNETEMHDRFRENMGYLASPQIWSQILSGAGFLLPIPFVWFRTMQNLQMRLYSSVLIVWIGAMLFFGVLPESRIFGELIGFLSVYCALQFDTFINCLATENRPSN